MTQMGRSPEGFMDKGDYVYSEARLAEHIGISRKNLAAVRIKALTKDVHWANRRGQIALSLKGVSHLLMQLDLGAAVLPTNWHEECLLDPPAKNGEVLLLLMDRDHHPAPIKMRITRIFPNPYLVEAQEPGRSQRYRVTVKSNLRLITRMEIDCIPDPGRPGFWQMIGRPPRWRGRW